MLVPSAAALGNRAVEHIVQSREEREASEERGEMRAVCSFERESEAA